MNLNKNKKHGLRSCLEIIPASLVYQLEDEGQAGFSFSSEAMYAFNLSIVIRQLATAAQPKELKFC